MHQPNEHVIVRLRIPPINLTNYCLVVACLLAYPHYFEV